MQKLMESIILNANEANKPVEGDYIGEDGLLYCRDCHTPKQYLIDRNCGIEALRGLKVGCLCECQARKEQERLAQEREQQKAAHIEELRDICFKSSELYKEARLEKYGNNYPPIINISRKYIDNFEKFRNTGQGLILYGDVGRGKSYIAASIANALIDMNIPVLMISFDHIVSELQADFQNRRDYLESLTKYALLIIDDFGSERDTEYMREIIYSVIDDRYSAHKPLILTTNLSGVELSNLKDKDLFNRRIFSRINEICVGIEVKGENYRELLAKQAFLNMKSILK